MGISTARNHRAGAAQQFGGTMYDQTRGSVKNFGLFAVQQPRRINSKIAGIVIGAFIVGGFAGHVVIPDAQHEIGQPTTVSTAVAQVR
ncbi:hypothetical protein VMT65_11730 [Nocardia sp. CDC153]|uniref:hypothetical protein n=1 Tax=Nocardia sp. CDC153 TaxID=3112167 RepID=UPI002DBF80F2|nr:hypothetical protein [Nocardia sp. CDC153]MEC3953705.1 hypothetical protein [Nocardia sp. CDC153]